MPNRIIKESVKRSPEIDLLSWFEEVVFYRLIVTADDYGRLDGRTVVLKNDLFPTKETVTKKAIEDAISKLVSVGLLIPYVDAESGMPYLAFAKWEKHQRVRDSKARYPAPPDGLTTRGNSPQFAAIRRENPLARAESESESKYESEYESKSEGERRARARFTPPTVDDVQRYASEKGWTAAQIDPQRFVDFYASKGWKVGSSPMKDWKAAARTWAARDRSTERRPERSGWTNPALDYDQRQTDADYFSHVFDDFNAGGG